MNSAELPGLIVPVEARITKLEQGLKRANAAQKRASQQMERRAAQSAERLNRTYASAANSIGQSFGRLGPALLAGISVGAINTIGRRIRSVVDEVARIGDAAKTAGVEIEAFQELAFVSKTNRIAVDDMTDGLKELALRADEFIQTGGGPAAEAFGRLGFTATQLAQDLKEPDRLFETIVERLEELDDAARIRISDEVFGGTAAEKFAGLIERGADALRETRQQARDTGQVLDRDLIEKVAELDRRFAALTSRVSTFGKNLAVNIADASVKLATLRIDLDDLSGSMERAENLLGEGTADVLSKDNAALEEHKDAVAQILAEYHKLGEAVDQLTGPLFQSASHLAMIGEANVSTELAGVAQEMNTLVSELNDGTISAEEFENRIQELTTKAQTALSEVAAIDGVQFTNVTAALGGFVTMMQAAVARARELRATLPGANAGGTADPTVSNPDANDPRGAQISPPPRAVPPSRLAPGSTSRPNLPSVDASFGSALPATGGGGGRGANAWQRQLDIIAEETALLQRQTVELERLTGAEMRRADAVELARTKADLLNAALRSGQADTPALRAQIDGLAEAYANASQEAELAADRIREIQDASRAGADSIASVFEGMATGALSAEQAVGRLIVQILRLSLRKRLLESASNSTGLFGNFLQILGAGFDAGGFTGPGPKHEPAGIVHRGEFVMSKSATQAIGVPQLNALHNAAKNGYASGGYVGSRVKMPVQPRSQFAQNPVVNISAPITVEGSAGTPEQNSDLARRMAAEMELSMRGVVVREIREQMRPGNMLHGRS